MNRQIEGKFESNLSGDAEIEMPVSSALDVPHGRTDGTSGGSGAKSQKAALAVRRCRHPIPIFSRDAMQYECSEARGRRERKRGGYERDASRSRRKVSNTIRQCHFHIEATRAMVKCSLVLTIHQARTGAL